MIITIKMHSVLVQKWIANFYHSVIYFPCKSAYVCLKGRALFRSLVENHHILRWKMKPSFVMGHFSNFLFNSFLLSNFKYIQLSFSYPIILIFKKKFVIIKSSPNCTILFDMCFCNGNLWSFFSLSFCNSINGRGEDDGRRSFPKRKFVCQP